MECFHTIQFFTSEDVNWWTGVVWITCGLLWCFYQLFGLLFWRHPFTVEDPLVSKWCNAIFLQIYSDLFQQILFSYFKSIPLRLFYIKSIIQFDSVITYLPSCCFKQVTFTCGTQNMLCKCQSCSNPYNRNVCWSLAVLCFCCSCTFVLFFKVFLPLEICRTTAGFLSKMVHDAQYEKQQKTNRSQEIHIIII